MSKHYTDEDVRKAVQLSCPCGSVAQHDPRQNQECAWALDLGLAVVEHIAPAIAARALREAALSSPDLTHGWRMALRARADEIERGQS